MLLLILLAGCLALCAAQTSEYRQKALQGLKEIL